MDNQPARIHAAVLSSMLSHTRANHPNEAAGLLGAEPNGVIVASVALGSGTRDYVRISRERLLQAAAYLTQQGLTCAGTYHSHPFTPAYPTSADRHILKPGQIMVIISGEIEDVRTFRLDSLSGKLVEAPVLVLRSFCVGDFVAHTKRTKDEKLINLEGGA